MKGNRRTGTEPERLVRSHLHRRGLRFRKDYFLAIPGARGVRGDIVFPRQRLVIFIDGCFWHNCPDHGRSPARNSQYWSEKLQKNVRRDRLVTERLSSCGWTVMRFWEHVETTEVAAAIGRELDRIAFRNGEIG
jgi:DNA mismatch endonuclease (patch repair protein)